MSVPRHAKNNVFIGYDFREDDAYNVCKHTLYTKSPSLDTIVHKLDHKWLRSNNYFFREWHIDQNGQYWDKSDNRPFSTEFSHSRFLVPYLAKDLGFDGWVLYCDCDFMFRTPVEKLFEQVNDKYAVMCVPFEYEPEKNTKKMDGVVQSRYHRKLWSSLILWNLDHPANYEITHSTDMANNTAGSLLHAFNWLLDDEIGFINESWNYIPNISPNTKNYNGEVNAVHFSEGGPWFNKYAYVEYAKEWRLHYKDYLYNKVKGLDNGSR